MDATPLTLGQEFSGYVSQLVYGIKALKNGLEHLSELAQEERQLVQDLTHLKVTMFWSPNTWLNSQDYLL